MPTKPKKPCAYRGCPNLTTVGIRFCEVHDYLDAENEKYRHRQYKNKRTDNKEQSFYSSTAWRTLRTKKLSMNPICEKCGLKLATMVDHKIPIKKGGAPLDIGNTQSLCWGCHIKKTAQERPKG